MTNSQFEVRVLASSNVSELKEMIRTRTNVPIAQQRLIYRGRQLKNDDILKDYGMADGHVLQLVAQAGEASEPDIMRWTVEAPTTLFTRRRRRLQRRRELDITDRFEAIRQNLLTLGGLFQARRAEPDETETQVFDFRDRVLEVGQWVDVKDTVDQWLEAQVIQLQVSETGTLAYIHYNGWPSRWDEWIETGSARIQPFRTHTRQSLHAQMHSPLPSTALDAENIPASGPHDLNEYIGNTCRRLEELKEMMEKYMTLSVEVRQEQANERLQIANERRRLLEDLESISVPSPEVPAEVRGSSEDELAMASSQLAPLLDRMGRLLSDIAPLVGNSSSRAIDDVASVSSSLITNESGQSINPRRLQIPVMPTPSDLITPRLLGSEVDVHISLHVPRGLSLP
eukprot:CAMPEP_0204896414 /NCGR_PEP_ID=MMETSP1397-20131031/147_1 /ASSEMBLY_ACC=CAM_ASM_000891 /TAXON_ID=49980 /ORGANISM="Climacostomum Climacostomum virens, Strain Stock W-24" /LENGTH=397 /DNA_ID=CAMNT_0052064017 /DNA_START=26 /DNA_END=1219 /DNA_ORIENTATION=+